MKTRKIVKDHQSKNFENFNETDNMAENITYQTDPHKEKRHFSKDMYNIAGHVNMYNIAAGQSQQQRDWGKDSKSRVYIAWNMSRSTEKLTRKGEEERLSIPVAKLDENNKK